MHWKAKTTSLPGKSPPHLIESSFLLPYELGISILSVRRLRHRKLITCFKLHKGSEGQRQSSFRACVLTLNLCFFLKGRYLESANFCRLPGGAGLGYSPSGRFLHRLPLSTTGVRKLGRLPSQLNPEGTCVGILGARIGVTA